MFAKSSPMFAAVGLVLTLGCSSVVAATLGHLMAPALMQVFDFLTREYASLPNIFLR